MGLDMYLYKKDTTQVAYWRKANAIHGWFDNLKENGLDNCEDVTVTVPMLVKLRDTCYEVLTKHDEETAMDLLPPTEGFFFGSNNIDEWYWKDVQETYDVLTNIIESSNEDDLYEYHAWW